MALKNRYADAFNSSYPGVHRKNGPRKNDILLGGVNYGRTWNEEDQAIYDLYLKSLEFDNNVDLMNYMNQYNSPSAQVQRMHQAGLNPDLQNIDNTPSSAENVQAPSAPAGNPHSQTIAQYAGVAQQFLQLIPQALDLYSSFTGSMQSLEMNQLNIDSQMQELGAFDAIGAFSPEDFDGDGNLKQDSLSKLSNFTDRRLISLGYDINKRRNSRSSSRRARQYLLGVDNLVRNNNQRLRSGVYSKYYDASRNRSEYLHTLGQYGYDLTDDNFVSILKDFNEIVYKDNKQSANNRYTTNSNKVGLKLMEQGQKNINNGNKISGSIEYIIGLLLINNMMPSFSSTKSPKGTSTTFGF